MEEILKKISEQWFLREPALFALYCLQQFEANDKMSILFRCGRGKIQYNPSLLKGLSTQDIELRLKIELIRLFLKHPYERQPDGVSRASLALGSDVTIKSGYEDSSADRSKKLPLIGPEFFKLQPDMPFEWYVRHIDELLPEANSDDEESEGDETSDPSANSASDKKSSSETKDKMDKMKELLKKSRDKSELWEEDDMKVQEINDLIDKMNQWGTLPGHLVQQIQASTKARIDYRKIMQGFRGSILSSKTKLTRMRPNRRTGFEQMGSLREFDTKLLVAVDVSGSISDTTLSHFYSVINNFFKYGIHEIDCVQFDCELGEVKPLRKASRTVQIYGRGGTLFQPIFDYLKEHNYYDGLIILTDGMAPHPKMDDQIKAEILWVCEDERSYEQCKDWMQLYGRVCWMYL